jgi:hypothetical protein
MNAEWDQISRLAPRSRSFPEVGHGNSPALFCTQIPQNSKVWNSRRRDGCWDGACRAASDPASSSEGPFLIAAASPVAELFFLFLASFFSTRCLRCGVIAASSASSASRHLHLSTPTPQPPSRLLAHSTLHRSKCTLPVSLQARGPSNPWLSRTYAR